MQTLRKKILSKLSSEPKIAKKIKIDPKDYAIHVFDRSKLQKFLSEKTFFQMQQCIEKQIPISPVIADQIASAMKAWAIANGASHYTHWFQPLTGATAEKHDSFFYLDSFGNQLEKFEGEQLVQQIPEFPNISKSGVRNTFEARGYSAWDPSSPAFLYGTTLCIPTTFVSYTGIALDHKSPLLKSLEKLDHAATEVCRFFDKNTSKVTASLGWEQEFFLADRALVQTRPDLMLTGRTLMGHMPSKGQQFSDHYFGSIPTRVSAYLNELEYECKLLGIPIKTKHNEVAPSQYEIASVFEAVNIAVDHNALLMDVMDKVAYKHNFVVLLHEKPYQHINGSGKHSNWSLNTNTGINLLSPSKTPMGNLQFLSFFVNSIAAVLKHEALLRASSVSASNDLRLGQNEAPTAILSIFIGKHLTQVLEDLENVSKGKLSPKEKTDLKLNVIGKIPEILLDNTDSDRTSPFAFTGNKFEYRSVGSKSNSAKATTVLNAIVTEQLIDFKNRVDDLVDSKNMKKDDAIFNILREIIIKIKDFLLEDFDSDQKDDKSKNTTKIDMKSTPESLMAYIDKSAVDLFENLEIFTSAELHARCQVDMQSYTSKIQIESRTLGDMSLNHIIPTAIKYQNILIENVQGIKEIFGTNFKTHANEQLIILENISEHIKQINKGVADMLLARKKANTIDDINKKALAYAKTVAPFLNQIRYHCDKLELTVDDSIWPLAKYRELLFIR
ncbi:MAG: glutamine synthetase III [Flavobacteriaceae bacterium]|nr:glutamine synthetase III [Flavobacteriaceae bacterium]